MEPWKAEQGDSPTYIATLRDENGAVYSDYLGTEEVTAVVWAGNELAPIDGAATAEWDDASDGTVKVTIVGAVTAELVPGTYFLKLEVDGQRAFIASLSIEEAPGAGPGRVAKITMRHLRKHYKSVEKLLCKTDDPTALEARADAWDWFCDLLHRHYRCSGSPSTDYRFVPGISFGGSFLLDGYRDGRRSRELQEWLDADRLDLTTPVLDAMAFYALAQICGGQVEVGDEKGWGDFAAKFAVRAETMASCISAEIDTDGDGVNDLVIRLGVADTLEG